MSATEGPNGSDLSPPVGSPVATPWGAPSGPVLPAWGAPGAPAAPTVAPLPTTPVDAAGPIAPASWVPPAPVARVPAYTAYLTGDRTVSYAGFWRRFGGAFIDNLVLTLINLPINFVLQLLAGAAMGTSGSVGLGLVVLLLNLGLNIYIWWRCIPGRIGRHGATFGMSTMNISMVRSDGRSAVSAGTAFGRALLSFLLQVVFLVPVFAYVANRVVALEGASSDDIREILPNQTATTVFAFLLLLASLPTLWHLFDRRYQTLYDKFAGVVVIRD